MKISEVRELNNNDLNQKLYDLRQQLFELRRKKAVGSLEHPEEVSYVRKDIARCLMVLRERELADK